MTIDPALDAELERRGVEVVQGLLTRAAVTENSNVEGLAGPDSKWMSRRYVEAWLSRKAEERRQQEVSERQWMRKGVRAAIAAALFALAACIIALAAWLFPCAGR